MMPLWFRGLLLVLGVVISAEVWEIVVSSNQKTVDTFAAYQLLSWIDKLKD